jgi:hypothetical protein
MFPDGSYAYADIRGGHVTDAITTTTAVNEETTVNEDRRIPATEEEQAVQVEEIEGTSHSWSRLETLKLINLYAENKEQFESTLV